jgi:RHS repeat-associated protein
MARRATAVAAFSKLARLVASTAALVLFGALLATAPAAPAAAVDAPWSGTVSLEVSRSEVDVHDASAVMTATVSPQLAGPYWLSIYDGLGNLIGSCTAGDYYNRCNVTDAVALSRGVSTATNATRTFTAYVSQDVPSGSIPTNDVRAVSNTVSVHNTGWSGTVSLVISRTQVDVHDTSAVVTATVSPRLDGPYWLSIYDGLGNLIWSCTAGDYYSRCNVTDAVALSRGVSTATNATRTFTAYVSQDVPYGSIPTNDVRAVSNTVSTSNTGWSGTVSLEISRTQVDVHDTSAVVTATVSPRLDGPYWLSIYDGLGNLIWSCTAGDYYSRCNVTDAVALSRGVTTATNATRTFTAYVSQDVPYGSIPTNDVRAVSNTVSTSNTGWSGTVSLAISRTQVDVHDTSAVVTATVSPRLDGPYTLSIYDDKLALIGSCDGAGGYYTRCDLVVAVALSRGVTTATNATRTFTAYVSQDVPYGSVPTNDVRAVSNAVSVHNTGWTGTVSLAISRTEVDVFEPRTTLTATVTPRLDGPYTLSIYDDTQALIASCDGAGGYYTRCSDTLGVSTSATVVLANNATRTYTAYVSQYPGDGSLPSNDVRAISNTVHAKHLGWNGSVRLWAQTDVNGTPEIFASTSPKLAGPYYLSIYDGAGNLLSWCDAGEGWGTTCTVVIGQTHRTIDYRMVKPSRTYVAYVSEGFAGDRPPTSDPANDVRATSQGYSTAGNGPSGVGESDGGSNPTESCSQACQGDPVNSVTGEFWETNTDLAIPGLGPTVTLQRSFSTARKDLSGGFGYGWTSNYEMRLDPAIGATGTTLATASNIRVTQENGSAVVFTRESDGTYTAPPRVFATLELKPDGTYLFVRKQTQSYMFSASGQLARIQDRNGQGVALEYDAASHLSRVVDDHGRFLAFTWSADRISSVADHTGRNTQYSYSSLGDLTSVRLPDGSTQGYSYDTVHRIVSLTHPGLGSTSNAYDTASRVVEQTDTLGRKTTFAYGSGLTTVTDPTGVATIERFTDGQVNSVTRAAGTALETTSYRTYGATNQVESTTDPLDRVTRFTYDARGNRTSVTDHLGRVATTTYDSWNNPTSVTNGAGETSRLTYDASGNLATSTTPDGAVTTYAVNADGTVASMTDPLGRTTTYAYDANAYPATATGPDGSVLAMVHDSLGRVVASTDARGMASGAVRADYTSTFSYDALGRILAATNPLGAVTRTQYDMSGRPTTVTDALGATTTNGYDVAGQLVAITTAQGQGTTMTYDGAGRILTMTDAASGVTSWKYDALGRAVAVTDPLGRTTHTEFDAAGRVVATVQPSGARTTYTYDAGDQLTAVTNPLGKQATTSFDAAGRPVTVTDSDGRAVTTTYDTAGRPVSIRRADDSTLSWSYDAAGQVTGYTDAAGVTTAYTYDVAGRQASSTDTAGRTTHYTYDSAGLIAAVTYPGGGQVAYAHDAAARLVGVDYSDATPDVAYGYDAAGHTTSMSDAAGVTTYAYDTLGRLTSQSRGDASVGYGWGATGNLTSLTYPSVGTVHRTYDAAGQLTKVSDWQGGDYTYQWTVDGQVSQVAYPNGVTTSYSRDTAGQVLGIAAQNAAGLNLLNLAYGYTDAGLLANQTTDRSAAPRAPPATGSTSSAFTWDPLGRIAAITGEGAGAFGFDAAGSLTGTADGRALTYDAGRQLTSMVAPGVPAGPPAVTTTFGYDARGNRVSATADGGAGAGTVGTTFDLANHLTSVTGATGAITSYTYDGTGLRASATTGSGAGATVEQFTWDITASAPELLTDASHAYIYGAGSSPLAQVTLVGGHTNYLHTDSLGSVRTTTDAAGAVTSDADYDTYGVPRAIGGMASSVVTRFGYAGAYTDPTGYIYLRARFYDPASGQFLSRDPLESRTGTPYGYTGGNPLQFTDALGLDWLDDVGNWSAGFGDAITGGGTEQFRRLLNYTMNGESGDMVDHCSLFYTWGGYGGDVVNVGLLFIGGAEAGTALVERLDWAVAATSRVTVEASEVSSIAARSGSAALRSGVPAEAGGGARFVVSSDGVATDLVGSKNAISIGHYPEYVANAQATGARTFSMSDEAWNAMSPAEQWMRNQRFLDNAILRGSEIQLATPLSEVRAGSFLEREIGYLSGKGYVPNSAGTLMIPGGG